MNQRSQVSHHPAELQIYSWAMMPVTEIVAMLLSCMDRDDPEAALRIIARGLLAEGHPRELVEESREEARVVLKRQSSHAEEDPLLDLLDSLRGWASPGRTF